MSDESKFWLGFNSLAAVVLIVFAVTGKGCNDSDNRTIQSALDKGYTMTHDKGGKREFIAPGVSK